MTNFTTVLDDVLKCQDPYCDGNGTTREDENPAQCEYCYCITLPAKQAITAAVRTLVEGIISPNDWQGCTLLDEFGHHGKDCDRPGGCIERMNRDELREEQRAALEQALKGDK